MENSYHFIFGMARSGHTAILYQIADQFKEKKMLGGKKIYERKWKIFEEDNFDSKDMNFIFNFSDMDMGNYRKYFYGEKYFNFSKIPKPCKIFNILILRDPFNWMASCMKFDNKRPFFSKCLDKAVDPYWKNALLAGTTRIDLYKTQLRLAMNKKEQKKYKNFIIINYNKWFVEKKYRKWIVTEKLGLDNFVDNKINQVAEAGGGSSFDKMSFQHRAQNMDVLNRWKYFENDERYMRLVSDPELVKFSEEFFDFNPLK